MSSEKKIDISNTKEKGLMKFLVYFDFVDNHFVGVCLTFNIVLEGDSRDEIERELREAAQLHIESVRANNLSDNLLNRPAPKEYWDIYERLNNNSEEFFAEDNLTGGHMTRAASYDSSVSLKETCVA